MNKNQKLSNLDVHQMSQRMYDEDNDAQRVVIVGSDLKIDAKIDVPEQKSIEIKEIHVPVIVKEVEIKEIKVPEIVKQFEIKEIEQVKIVVQEKIQTIEVPVIVKEQVIQTIEKPIVVEKVSKGSKTLNVVIICQTLAIIGLVIGIILK